MSLSDSDTHIQGSAGSCHVCDTSTSRTELQRPVVGTPPSGEGARFGGPRCTAPSIRGPHGPCVFLSLHPCRLGLPWGAGVPCIEASPHRSWPDGRSYTVARCPKGTSLYGGRGHRGFSQEGRVGLLFCVPLSKKVQMMSDKNQSTQSSVMTEHTTPGHKASESGRPCFSQAVSCICEI